MNRDQILDQIRALAATNDGQPVGERTFQKATGIARSQLWQAGFAKYNEAVAAAGFLPNTPNGPLETSTMLRKLAALTLELGRFPTKGHIKVARAQNPAFPSYEAFLRLSGGAFKHLPEVLLGYCRASGQHDVLPHISSLVAVEPAEIDAKPKSARVIGYVYLVKHDRHFKIGRSNDVTRRRREIALLLPNELEHVHVIETDDPEGIEQYWHRRFESRRTRGEWFDLKPEDVAAFRRRRYQ